MRSHWVSNIAGEEYAAMKAGLLRLKNNENECWAGKSIANGATESSGRTHWRRGDSKKSRGGFVYEWSLTSITLMRSRVRAGFK